MPAAAELKAFVARMETRVQEYLALRADQTEQHDHLRHVADRARWLYHSELQRAALDDRLRIPEHDDDLIEACVLSHDLGKWVPREALQALLPADLTVGHRLFQELNFTANESALFLLGARRRLALERDGYVPEYDAAHHLVSAFQLVSDASLDFHQLAPEDQAHLIRMIVGHQFGSYFKEQLLKLSLQDEAVTPGMLVDAARPDRVADDRLACAFHDADISDLLYVGSLERRPHREDLFHTGGLVKILLINFTNMLFRAPGAPAHYEGCLQSCQFTVTTVCDEFMTVSARERGIKWRAEAQRFLGTFRQKSVAERLQAALLDEKRAVPDRLRTARTLTYVQAREFLRTPAEA